MTKQLRDLPPLVYLGNVAQYIHRTQRMKKETAEAEATILKKAA